MWLSLSFDRGEELGSVKNLGEEGEEEEPIIEYEVDPNAEVPSPSDFPSADAEAVAEDGFRKATVHLEGGMVRDTRTENKIV